MSEWNLAVMTAEELELAVDWAAAEGWNPGLHDARVFHATDPDGFLLGRLNGEAVALVSAVRYGDAFGFLGFYIVAPGRRNRGYGGRVALAAMEHLRGCRCIGLDGVEAQQANYARHGFRWVHPNFRYQGRGPDPAAPPLPAGQKLCAWHEVEPAALRAYDRRHFPADRGDFVARWCSAPGVRAWAAVSAEGIQGFGVLRPCREGFKVGPLFAASPATAAGLLGELRRDLAPDSSFVLDVPGNNPDALALAENLGMVRVFATARMYQGTPPALPDREIFGITSFELG